MVGLLRIPPGIRRGVVRRDVDTGSTKSTSARRSGGVCVPAWPGQSPERWPVASSRDRSRPRNKVVAAPESGRSVGFVRWQSRSRNCQIEFHPAPDTRQPAGQTGGNRGPRLRGLLGPEPEKRPRCSCRLVPSVAAERTRSARPCRNFAGTGGPRLQSWHPPPATANAAPWWYRCRWRGV